VTYPGFNVDLDTVGATQIDEDSVLLVPAGYNFEPESEFARWQEGYDQHRCWKTTVVYEQIGENHPRVVPYDSTSS
jgi:hypothetical protein